MAEKPKITAKLVKIYRYPVKGLSPERLQEAELVKGQTLPFDRAFAIENGKGKFDPDDPKYLPKVNFLMLMRHEKLARLKSVFDDEARELSISLDRRPVVNACLDTRDGRQTIEKFMADYMSDELNGAPRLVQAPGHSFSDVSAKCLHIINLASVRELEKMIGQKLDPLRFRANLMIDGAKPFDELDWVGKTVASEACALKVFKRTMRCPATNVDPDKGVRDRTIPDFLFKQFGHHDFGVYAKVIKGGILTPGTRLVIS